MPKAYEFKALSGWCSLSQLEQRRRTHFKKLAFPLMSARYAEWCHDEGCRSVVAHCNDCFLRGDCDIRYCSTLSGKLSTTSSYVTLNALFEVGEDKLAPIDVWLTWLEGTYVLLDGAPEPLNMAVAILSKLAPAVVRDFWVEETAWRSKDVFKDVVTSGKN
ncbi:uncharacterized protein LOC119178340 isoform X3 [Rhipicephalus microplus]|uniref:uncharacterized protein LOC119178340 isoform X3 n=1 Tax=Rhipicephalus microplus TaxID=6941 RepID=UPI003F6CF7A5